MFHTFLAKDGAIHEGSEIPERFTTAVAEIGIVGFHNANVRV